MLKNLFLAILVTSSLPVLSQKINIDRPVNTPLSNERNPSISADGRFMILETDYGEERLYPVMSKQIGTNWIRPEEVMGIYNKLTNDQGWNLNYDGSELFFASSRYGGVGQGDIWHSKKYGDKWSAPVNLAKPVNSAGTEKDPSISPDGKKLYFVRENGKTGPNGQKCGKIYYTEFTSGIWKDPVELPAPVNSGCECSPKILADNKTLVFASIRSGGKGGFDLYQSQLQENGKWSVPVALTYINTDKDEAGFAIPGKGDYMYVTGIANGKDDIFKVKIPENLKPLPYHYVNCPIKSEDSKPITCKAFVTKISNGQSVDQLYNLGKEGILTTVVSGNENYDLTVFPVNKGYFYHSSLIDPKSTPQIKEIRLLSLKPGVAISLHGFTFNEKSDIMSGKPELDKVVKILKDNPEINIEIGIDMPIITLDTLQTPGLTELKIDTLVTNEIITKEVEVIEPDSTVSIEVLKDTIEVIVIKKTFHNDRTEKDAGKIKEYLISKGIPEQRITAKGYGDLRRKSFGSAEERKVELVIK